MNIYLKLAFCVLALFGVTINFLAANSPVPKGDSIYTKEYISKISVTEPQRALKLIDEMEKRQLMPDFRLDNMRSIVYQNGLNMYRMALAYSLKAYHSDFIDQSLDDALVQLELIVDQYNATGNYTESTRYATEGVALARKAGNKRSEACFLLYIGMNKREMGLKSEVDEYIEQAINLQKAIAENSREWYTVDNLIYTYGVKITYAFEDKEYQKAIDLLPRYEKLMEQLKSCPDIPDGMYDMRWASAYAIYACIFVKNGEPEKGAEYYRKLVATDYSSTIDGKQMHSSYLIATKRYQDALRYLHEEQQLRIAEGDTVSYVYIRYNLALEAEAYMGLRDYKSASRVYKQMYDLSDSLHIREKQNGVLEFATIYETKEKETLLLQQSAKLETNRILLISAICIILLFVASLWFIFRHFRIVKAKNKVLVRIITAQMAYEQEALQAKLKIYNFTEQLKHLQSASEVSDEISAAEQEKTEMQSIFDQLNELVIGEKLYLNPDLSRDELVSRLRIDKNIFAQVLQEGAGVKFNEYINDLRIEYALHLMQSSPNYSLQAIATDSGFSNRGTFTTSFKKKTGMTPTEYRSESSLLNS